MLGIRIILVLFVIEGSFLVKGQSSSNQNVSGLKVLPVGTVEDKNPEDLVNYENFGEFNDYPDEDYEIVNKSYRKIDTTRSKMTADSKFSDKNEGSKMYWRSERPDCHRRPWSKRELLIGRLAFHVLCEYFGPRARDEIVSSLDSDVVLRARTVGTGENREAGGYDEDQGYAMAFEIQKPAMASCFKIILDDDDDHYSRNINAAYYSTFSHHRYPECFKKLAIIPQPNFQIIWLRNFPQFVRYFERVMSGRWIVRQVRIIVAKLIDQGLMENWNGIKSFEWARIKIAAWNNSQIQDSNERLKFILDESPRIFDICQLSQNLLLEYHDVTVSKCLREIVGNLLILEDAIQKSGTTLEFEFLGGNAFLVNILHGIKSILRTINVERNSQKYEHQSDFIFHDYEDSDIPVNLHNQRGIVQNDPFDWKRYDKHSSKPLLSPHHRLNEQNSIIRSIFIHEVLNNDLSNYPWAREFLSKWSNSKTENLHDRLTETINSIDAPSPDKLCHRFIINKGFKGNDECWTRYIAETLIVESELMKNGLSLESIHQGDSFLIRIIHFIHQALVEYYKKMKSTNGQQFRRTLTLLRDIIRLKLEYLYQLI